MYMLVHSLCLYKRLLIKYEGKKNRKGLRYKVKKRLTTHIKKTLEH